MQDSSGHEPHGQATEGRSHGGERRRCTTPESLTRLLLAGRAEQTLSRQAVRCGETRLRARVHVVSHASILLTKHQHHERLLLRIARKWDGSSATSDHD
eukprot:5066624-Prymnesium_polylepis.1